MTTLELNFKNLFKKQMMMRKVIYSLAPLILASVYFFGWRSLILLAVVTIFGSLTEWIFEKRDNKPISEAVIVTCILYTLTLPARTPYWIAVVGIIFGIVFGKEVFGGFGKNVFNPALVARAFVYVSFPTELTTQWASASTSFPGGFAKYITSSIDVLSSSTPMLIYRGTGTLTPYLNLLWGNIAGSLGETCAILIIIAAIYLIYTKTAAWQTIAGVAVGFISLSFILNIMGVTEVPNPLFGILSGGFLFGTVFMATDPISSPKTKEGKWIYGILIGLITVVIRGYALFAGGIMFAILIGNTFAPIIDEGVKSFKKYRKQSKKVTA
ncbi:RnfABCDGE type electron transport complex subunit D [Sporosalibacterium faouarense]|uniref:RnfABCDGE type electron transport complex subunit D n=1 Tax=Sporosalibacterium faouarense TaxID=516123 RepID=UPI003C76FDBA